MKAFKSQDILNIAKNSGQYLNQTNDFDLNLKIDNVSIDTRETRLNSLFIALKGKNFNGSDFILDVLEKFESLCVTDDKNAFDLLSNNKNIILVKSSEDFLKELAVYRRNLFLGKVLAITGSYGKTTLKELLSKTLSKFLKVSYTKKNLNNQLGVPLSILNMSMNSELLILELGTNHPGEIDFLSSICKPDISIITAISTAHIGNFKSLKDLAIEKISIINHMKKNSIVISDSEINFYDMLIQKSSEKSLQLVNINKIRNDDFNIKNISYRKNFYTRIDFEDKKNADTFYIDIYGYKDHNLKLCIYALYTGSLFALKYTSIADQIKKHSIPIEGRGNIVSLAIDDFKINIINDSYNSSLDTLKSGILSTLKLADVKKIDKTIFILGDIKELNQFANQIYKELEEFLLSVKLNNLILIGNDISIIDKKVSKSISYYHNVGSFMDSISLADYKNSLIYIKGSNSMQLSKILEYFNSFSNNSNKSKDALSKNLKTNLKRRLKSKLNK